MEAAPPDLLPAASAFVAAPDPDAGGPGEEERPAFAAVAALVPARVPLLELLRLLGPLLTGADVRARRRATLLLALLLERWAAAGECPDAALQRAGGLEPLLGFFSDRLADYPSVGPALRALRALLRAAERAPQLAPRAATAACRAVLAHLRIAAMEQPLRQAAYQLISDALASPTHAAALLARGSGGPSDSPFLLELAAGFVAAMDGEKDPRCLLVCLAIAERLLSPAPPLRLGDVAAALTEELFDVTSCYYPITFTPPPNDPHGVTRAALVTALRRVFAATPRLAPHVLPLLLEKLGSDSPDAKRDAKQTLRVVAPAYGAAALAPFLPALSSALLDEVLFSSDAVHPGAHPRQTAAALVGGNGAAAAVAGGSGSVWTARSGGGGAAASVSAWMVGVSAGAIGVDFSGVPSLHARSGYGLFTYETLAAGDAAAGVAAAPPTDAGAAVGVGPAFAGELLANAALAAIADVTRLLSAAVDHRGGGDAEWHAFVTPLVAAALAEVEREPDSLHGRASARILCAVASASHHALATVLHAVVPVVVSARGLDVVGGARGRAAVALLGLLAGLLHTVDPRVDHPPGGHPLSTYASRLYDVLLDALMGGGAAAAGDAVSEARCIAAAAICDLAVRPASPLLAPEIKFSLTEQLTALLMRDGDEAVREACLRCLCTVASVRPLFCAAVIEVSVPRLIGVVREYFRTAAVPAAGAGGLQRTSSARSLGSVVSAPYAASIGDWVQSPHIAGLPDPLSGALYALSQLACVSTHTVQHTIVPQLLELAVAEEPIAAAAAADGAPPPRGRVSLRVGVRPDGHADDGRAAIATIETICRLFAFKASARDAEVIRALLEHSPASLAAWAAARARLRPARASSEGRELAGAARRGGQGDDGAALEAAARLLRGGAAAVGGTPGGDVPRPAADSSDGGGGGGSDGGWEHEWAGSPDVSPADSSPSSPPSCEGSPTSSCEPLRRELPLLVVPTLYCLVVDSVRDAPYAATAAAAAGAAADATELQPAAPASLPLRARAAIELAFRTAATAAPRSAQARFRADVARAVLVGVDAPAGGDEGATLDALIGGGDEGAAPSGASAAAAARASGEAAPPPILCSAPWFAPLARGAHVEQQRLLPILLKVLCCCSPGEPPTLTGLRTRVAALAAAAFSIPCGRLPSCEDPQQRLRRRAMAQRDAGGGGGLPSAVPWPVVDLFGDALDSALPQEVDDAGLRLFVELRRAAVLCAQAAGMAFNRAPPVGDRWAAADVRGAVASYVSATLDEFVGAIAAGSGIGVHTLLPPPPAREAAGAEPAAGGGRTPAASPGGGTLAGAPPPLAIRSPAPRLDSALGPGPDEFSGLVAGRGGAVAAALLTRARATGNAAGHVVTARERGVLLLVWLTKALAMRPGAAAVAGRCVRALLHIVAGVDIALADVVPVSAHLSTLAGHGLGLVVADAPPRHPFNRDSGALVAGVYKQRLFSIALAYYSERLNRDARADESQTPTSPERSCDTPDGSPQADARESLSDRAPSPLAVVTPGARSGGARSASSRSTRVHAGANAEETVPLLLAICSMVAHLPQAIVLGEVRGVLPLAIRTLELAALGGVRAAGDSGCDASPKSAAVVAAIPELPDAVAISALHCLQMLLVHAPDAVAVHLLTLVPLLLRLSVYSRRPPSRPAVRVGAIDCLRGFVGLPYYKLHAARATVIGGLVPALDDPRRAVRRRAAACRNEWATLTGSEKKSQE